MEALQSKQLVRATRMEILTQHDGAEFMRGVGSQSRVRRGYRQVAHSHTRGLSLTRNFIRETRVERHARQVSATGKSGNGSSHDTSLRKIRKVETHIPEVVTSLRAHRNRDPIISRIGWRTRFARLSRRGYRLPHTQRRQACYRILRNDGNS